MPVDETSLRTAELGSKPEAVAAGPAVERQKRVFIGYKKTDRARAGVIAAELTSAGFEVWWDTKILHGQDWRQVIANQVNDADVVVVLWSALSVKSRWVLDEASAGEKRGVLVPALLDDVEPPFGFRGIQTAKLFLDDRNERETFVESIRALSKDTEAPTPSAPTRGPAFPEISPDPTLGRWRVMIAIVVLVAPMLGWWLYRSRSNSVQEPASPSLLRFTVRNLVGDRISDDEVTRVLAAVNRQIVRDFAPHWRRAAELRLTASAESSDEDGIVILEAHDEGDMPRYHYFEGKVAKVVIAIDDVAALGESWSVGLSHEVLETLADFNNAVTVLGPRPDDPKKRRVAFSHEICNPVAAESYVVDNVDVSNFVFPSYFDEWTEAGVQVDFLGRSYNGKRLRPLYANPGGYLTFTDVQTGKESTWTRPSQ